MIKQIFACFLLLYSINIFSSEYRGPHSPTRRHPSPSNKLRFTKTTITYGLRDTSESLDKNDLHDIEKFQEQGPDCAKCCTTVSIFCCLFVGFPCFWAYNQTASKIFPPKKDSMSE